MLHSLKEIQYSVGYEANARRLNGFEVALSAPDFEERYRRLISGLDVGSINFIDEIIRRLRLIFAAHEGDVLDLYSEYEKQEILRQRSELISKTICLSDELFFWGGCFLPIKNFESSVYLYRYGLDKVQTLAMIGDAAIIDAGGYVGDSAWLLSSFTSGDVYAFEPLSENISKIYQTIEYNALSNVKPVYAGLGAARGTMKIRVSKSTGCATISNKLVEEQVKTEDVTIVALDDFVVEEKISRIGLIKTDVEGAEQMLLAGALEVIKRDRPILLISIYHNASDFFDIKPMIEGLNLGYEFRIHHPPINNISGETILIAEVPKLKNDAVIPLNRQKCSLHVNAMLQLWQEIDRIKRGWKMDGVVFKEKISAIEERKAKLEKLLNEKTGKYISADNALKKYHEEHHAEVGKLKEGWRREVTVFKEKIFAMEERKAKLEKLLDEKTEKYISADNALKEYKEKYLREVGKIKKRLSAVEAQLSSASRVCKTIADIIK